MMSFDIVFGLVPAIVAVASIVVSFVVYLLTRASSRGASERPLVHDYFYWFIGPAVALLGRLGVTPNMVTLTSLFLSAFAAVGIATGHWFVATWLLMVASSCDVIDGHLARTTDQVTASGAFFDSFIDRWAEGVVFLGFAILGQGGVLTIGAVIGLIASYGVSYARARGEGLGVVAKVGVMQRPARMVVLNLSIIAAALMTVVPVVSATLVASVGVWIVAFGAATTAIHRVLWVMRQLNRPAEVAPPELVERSAA